METTLDRQQMLDLYRMMCRIRAFEDAAEVASKGGVTAFGQAAAAGGAKVRGPLHLSTGQEAVPTGVCAHLSATDYLTSTHRGHGHTLAKGANIDRMMQELFGKASGFCGGKGGSMHIADFSVGMLGANGVVAAGIPIAVGAAQSIKLRSIEAPSAATSAISQPKRSAIAVSFFGDGAINRGPFGESLNWAATMRLPMLFVCEDNQWSATTRTSAMSAGDGAAARARAYGVPAEEVDGMDVAAVWATAGKLIDEIRTGGGPRLLHARTYRYKGHVSVDPAAYRDPAELQQAMQRDTFLLAEARLSELGVTSAETGQVRQAAGAEVALAVESANAAPWPAPDQAFTDIQTTGDGSWI